MTSVARAVAIACLCMTCATQPRGESVIVLAEGVTPLRARVLGVRRGVGWGCDHVLIKAFDQDAPRDLRGSPVLTTHGVVFGAIERRYGEAESLVYGVWPAHVLDEGWRRGGSRVRCERELVRGEWPGKSVRVLYAWGAVRLGWEATVTEQRAKELLCLITEPTSAGPPVGKGEYALERAPVVAIGEWRGGFPYRVRATGQHIGVVTYVGRFGAVGTLSSMAVDGIAIGMSVDGASRQEWVLARSRETRRWLSLSVNIALLGVLEPLASVSLEWAADDGEPMSATVQGSWREPAAAAVGRIIAECDVDISTADSILITLATQ